MTVFLRWIYGAPVSSVFKTVHLRKALFMGQSKEWQEVDRDSIFQYLVPNKVMMAPFDRRGSGRDLFALPLLMVKAGARGINKHVETVAQREHISSQNHVPSKFKKEIDICIPSVQLSGKLIFLHLSIELYRNLILLQVHRLTCLGNSYSQIYRIRGGAPPCPPEQDTSLYVGQITNIAPCQSKIVFIPVA